MFSSAHVLLCCLTSKVGDWTIRIDRPHGNESYHRKHVHIQKRGLKGEYSWNTDGTRHDEHRFPTSEQCIGAAKKHAATALNVPISSLSLIVGVKGGARITIRAASLDSKKSFAVFNSYVRKSYAFIVFRSEMGLVLVVNEDTSQVTSSK